MRGRTTDSTLGTPVAAGSGMAESTRYWRIGTHGGEDRHNYWPQMRASHDIAMGWPGLDDLSKSVDDPDQLRALVVAVRNKYAVYRAQKDQERSIRYIRDQAWQFARGIKSGDIVIAADGDRVLGVGEVKGDYRFDPDIDPEAPHRRRVSWLHLDDWVAPNPPGKTRPQGFRTTCWQITDPGTIARIRERLRPEVRSETSSPR
jgi:hypothetical protein